MNYGLWNFYYVTCNRWYRFLHAYQSHIYILQPWQFKINSHLYNTKWILRFIYLVEYFYNKIYVFFFLSTSLNRVIIHILVISPLKVAEPSTKIILKSIKINTRYNLALCISARQSWHNRRRDRCTYRIESNNRYYNTCRRRSITSLRDWG